MDNKTIEYKIKTNPNITKPSLCHWAVHCRFDGKTKKGSTQSIDLILFCKNKFTSLTKIKAALACKTAVIDIRILGSGHIK